METENNVIDKPIETELKGSFLDYAMSVITSRALPDARDGLKPVQRRILYAMFKEKMTYDKGFYKCARIVGDVIGKYHPHGDSSVYEALVRMAQEWCLLATLVEGQGNFGSMDGDSAAAMRYTEARLSKLANELLNGLNKDTVNFKDNYDGREQEPVVLPAKFPAMLVNGISGIAVGMASNMPPHNLGESIDAIIAQYNNPDISVDELMTYIKGPDFPTAGTIFGTEGIENAFKTGKGTITIRGKAHFEEIGGSLAIVITQVPFQVGRHTLKAQIKEIQTIYDEYKIKQREQKKKRRFFLEKPKKALDFVKKDGVYDDDNKDSTEYNLRIVVELKDGVDPNVALKHLYKYTSLQTTLSINNTVLIPIPGGKTRPRRLNLKQLIEEYIKHQKEVYTREAEYELKKNEKTFKELQGLSKALKELDRVLKIIRQADTDHEAIDGLTSLLRVDEEQAKYILDRKIRTISNFEQKDIHTRLETLTFEMNRLKGILESKEKLKEEIINHLLKVKDEYGKERKTNICPPISDISNEELIQNERIVTTISNKGYIKTTLESHYKTQRRNGRGVNSIDLDKDDFVKHLEILYKHDTLLLFTDFGKVYSLKGYDIPEMQSNAKGVHIFNLLPGIEDEEQIQSVVSVKDFTDNAYLFFSTAKGKVKKTPLSDYEHIRRTGIIAINLDKEDRLVNVSLTDGTSSIVLVTKFGQAIKFSEDEVRPKSRDTQGVKGIELREGDCVISADIDESFGELFIITEQGYGKRSELSLFKLQTRGGVGVRAIKTSEKTGNVVGSLIIESEDAVYVLSSQGSLIKLRADNLSQFSRNAQGTKVINLREKDAVQSIARLSDDEQEITSNEELVTIEE